MSRKALLAMLAAMTALALGALAPAPAAAMDDQEDLTECIELDWWGFDIGDCFAEDGSGGGGSSGGDGTGSGSDEQSSGEDTGTDGQDQAGDPTPGEGQDQVDEAEQKRKEDAEAEEERRQAAQEASDEKRREQELANQVAQIEEELLEERAQVIAEIVGRIRAERKALEDQRTALELQCNDLLAYVSAENTAGRQLDLPTRTEYDSCSVSIALQNQRESETGGRLHQEEDWTVAEAIKQEAIRRAKRAGRPPAPPSPPAEPGPGVAPEGSEGDGKSASEPLPRPHQVKALPGDSSRKARKRAARRRAGKLKAPLASVRSPSARA